MGEETVLSLWESVKTLVNELEVDVVKNAGGVAAAGVRARKGLRALKTAASQLVKLTVEEDKKRKEKK